MSNNERHRQELLSELNTSASVADPRLDVPRKPVVATLRPDRNSLAVDWRRQQGAIFERVLDLARMTKQEASHAMGYPDASAVSRWASGVERAQWDRIADIDQLRPWIAVAWGEATGAEVQTTVIVRRIA